MNYECKCVCESTGSDSRTRVKRIVYTDNEGHHSQDSAPRKPFPEAKLRRVFCLPRFEGLCADKTAAQMPCQLDDCSQVAANHIRSPN